MTFRDRVKELRRVRAGELRPNPKNWRVHGPAQRDALQAVLNEVGFADALLVTENKDGSYTLCDGHLRQDLMGDAEVPVLVLDLDEEEAGKLLAVSDPLGAMADIDWAKLEAEGPNEFGMKLVQVKPEIKSEAVRRLLEGAN